MHESEGSYVRWQAIAIEQLGYAVGLILSFAAAALGFALSTVKDSSYEPTCWSKACMLFSTVALLLSLAVGLWCVINRLRDFRLTRSIARDREVWRKEGKSDDEIDRRLKSRRAEIKNLGEMTWNLFWWQIGAFVFGIVCFTVAFGIAYRARLF